MLILECGAVLLDPSDGAEINALIAANEATLVTDINVSFDVPTAITQPSNIPGQPDQTINYNHTGNLVDDNVNATNVDFYDNLGDGRQFEGLVLFESSNEGDLKVHWIDSAATFSGG